MRRVRIGIDVGGTFTDAVAIDEETYDLIGQVKLPTTHGAAEGVALGIVQALQQLMQTVGIAPEEVRFIAHGTTQATNALLEGDVVPVGVVCTGSGFDGMRARSETQVGDLELAPGKWLRMVHAFAEAAGGSAIADAVGRVKQDGAKVVVAATPFSVDDPTAEREIMAAAASEGLSSTGTHEISKLYGLKIRTRTAMVNASILPRMVETADMTDASVKRSGIDAPLMIMRCDGGVMTVDEVRQRPILTMLSGPAAGVAGALMYEKISDGIFLEVGGTSTDMSAIRNGRVMVEYAEVGGHKTYLNSLDVRTVGLAGGSMIRVADGRVADVGPRSAHIAGFPYAVYAEPSEIEEPVLEQFAPKAGDPEDYVCIRCKNGKRYALTTACAANLLGYVVEGHYALGNAASARRAFAPLAAATGLSVEAVARQVLQVAAAKVAPTVEALLTQYGLEKRNTVLVGGGGGAAAVVPYLAESLGMEHRLAKNHQVISPIGVALALVRDVVERMIPYPTEADILRVRKEAEEAALRSGAAPGTVEVQVEVDAVRQTVRATATGATELRTKEMLRRELPEAELRAVAGRSMQLSSASTELVAASGTWYVYQGRVEERRFFGLMRRSSEMVRVLDAEGVVRLSKGSAVVVRSTAGSLRAELEALLARTTKYGDAGAELPEPYLFCGSRMVDLSGLQTAEQVVTMAMVELAGYAETEPVIILCAARS
ncbi:MAG TPA: hydantoinase/oxoprolinase family protein [Symbiobacteriaceae bacterium]|nr:hydantoinase/oxoprolinase family protein [Symbiobacteriaceae bacterium]